MLRKEKVVRRYKRLIYPAHSKILAPKKEIYFRPFILIHLFDVFVFVFVFQTHYNVEGVIVPWRWKRDKVLVLAFALCKEVREGKKSS